MAPATSRPRSRKDIRIAIVCALPFEAETIRSAFDKEWPYDYGKSFGDTNTYSVGAMGHHNVVLVCIPNIGINSATATAVNLCSSFPNLRFGFLVGICGAVPFIGSRELILGDCLISTHVIQYDFGRQHEDRFIRKKSMEDNLGRANVEIRSLLATLMQPANQERLADRLKQHLSTIQTVIRDDKVMYPGTQHDQLFESSYIHTHNPIDSSCGCSSNPGLCSKDCEIIGCKPDHLITRQRLCSDDSNERLPRIHFVRFGSANMVMRSGRRRDEVSREDDLCAFDMESSGLWDHIPTVVIKSASDYADSHKNKVWQRYAAITATAGLKAVLEQIQPLDCDRSIKMLPFTRDIDFTAREDILATLLSGFERRVPSYQLRKALVGMGGVGKTQIAIEYAYRLLELNPRQSIFWIHASSISRFEAGYRDIANYAKIQVSGSSNILSDVFHWLSDEDNGEWTMILDNVDDDKVFTEQYLGGKCLRDFFPTGGHGSVLVTSRSEIAAANIVDLGNSISVDQMTIEDSLKLLSKKSNIGEMDKPAAKALVEQLECLPLAITHASAYMVVRKMSLIHYTALLQKERSQIKLLAFDKYQDLRRDASAERAVLATWHISFSILAFENPNAASLLSLLGMFDNATVPILLLKDKSIEPGEDDLELEDCIGVLLSYSLVSSVKGDSLVFHSVKLHRLVQLAMRSWLGEHGKLSFYQKEAITALSAVLPLSDDKGQGPRLASELISHARQIMKYDIEDCYRPTFLSKIGALFGTCYLHIEAEKILCQAISLRKQRTLTERQSLPDDLSKYAEVLLHLGRFKEAEVIYREIIKEHENSGIRNSTYYKKQRELCFALMATGRINEAEAQALDVLKCQSDNPTVTAADIVHCMMALGMIYNAQGKHELALATSREYYKRVQETLDPDHRLVLLSINNYGSDLAQAGQYEESQDLLSKCFEKCKATRGMEHEFTLAVGDSLAVSYQGQRKLIEAEQLLHEIMDASIDLLGARHSGVTKVMMSLVDCFVHQRKFTEAESLCRATILRMETNLGKDHYQTLRGLMTLGKILYEQNHLAQAEIFLRRALTSFKESAGAEAPKSQESALCLCKVLERLNRSQEAESLRKQYNLPPDPDEDLIIVDAYPADDGSPEAN